MSRGKTLLILMILACSFAYPIPFLSAEDYTPLLRVMARDVYMTAGEANQLEIEIRNTGSFSVYEVEAVLSVPASTPGVSVVEYAHRVFNEIEGGKKKTYHPVIYIDSKTPLGTYQLTYQLMYIKRYKLGSVQPYSVTLQLGVVVDKVSKPRVKLNMEVRNTQLTAGVENRVNVMMSNIGQEPVYEVYATITSTSPYVAVLEGARFTHSQLDTNASVDYRSTVAVSRVTPLGVYTLTAAVSYEDGDGQIYHETFTLSVNVDSVEVEEQTTVVLSMFEAESDIVRPGDAINIELELACIGAEAHDVKTLISFDPGSSISPLTPTLVALGDLEPNQTAISSYRLMIDGEAGSGQYPARVTISYLDSAGIPKSFVETVTLSVRGIVSFRFLNTPEVTVEQGGIADLEADLLLIGTESVDFVQIDVMEVSPFTATFESHQYIGPIDPDSPVPFYIQFAVADGAEPGVYSLSLNVTYFDDLNRVCGSIIELSVSVVEAQSVVEVRSSIWEGFWLWLRRLFGVLP